MKFTLAALSLPLLSSAAVHSVAVAQSGLAFTPSTINAAVGDSIAFTFKGSPHTVAQGSFSGQACHPDPNDATPFYSGTGPQGKTWTLTINSTAPIPFYCYFHCTAGMVGVINPTKKKSFAKYQKAAGNVGTREAPARVEGGTYN